MFSSEKRGKHGWDELIFNAVYRIRKRIETLVANGKVQLSLSELTSYANGSIPTEELKRIFTLSSQYGTRIYSLDALFIDIEETSRADAIRNFCISLLAKLAKGFFDEKTESMIQWKDIDRANQKGEQLWAVYDSDLFKKRFFLSDFYARKMSNLPHVVLTSVEDRYLQDLITQFIGNNERIIQERYPIKQEYTKIGDIRDNGENSKAVNRLIIFFTIIRLIKRWSDFMIKNEEKLLEITDKSLAASVINPPDEDDLCLALFPISNTH